MARGRQRRRPGRRGWRWLAGALGLVGLAGWAAAAPRETHARLQAVQADGTSAWAGGHPFTLQGVLLCDPEEMLDATPRFLPWDDGANQFRLGGQWQIVFQAVAAGDFGGTTCWMGQNYGNLPWLHDSALSYANEAWVAEVLRLNHDPATGHKFRAGDLIEVTARRSLFYGGKRNINEAHDVDPAADFTIRLIQADYGLPAPAVLTLADVVDPGGDPEDWTTWPARFDPTRATGAEHYQGTRVRLNGLTLVTRDGWDATRPWNQRLCTVTDGQGRWFRLRHPRYALGPAPEGEFDVVGIFTQESGSGRNGTRGYEVFVQQVLPRTPPALEVGHYVRIAWPADRGNWRLEWRAEADAGEWRPVTPPPARLDGRCVVLLPPDAPRRFYRLQPAD